jgi:hypothetical protein
MLALAASNRVDASSMRLVILALYNLSSLLLMPRAFLLRIVFRIVLAATGTSRLLAGRRGEKIFGAVGGVTSPSATADAFVAASGVPGLPHPYSTHFSKLIFVSEQEDLNLGNAEDAMDAEGASRGFGGNKEDNVSEARFQRFRRWRRHEVSRLKAARQQSAPLDAPSDIH